MAETTTVTLSSQALDYPIHVGRGLLAQAGQFLSGTERIFVVTDRIVGNLYLKTLQKALAKFEVNSIQIEGGEAHKTLDTLSALYKAAFSFGLKRNDIVIALGGGIIGDITGLLAATYLRGLPFVQIPTTLLAQVDASVGGKVAVNYEHLKNMIGTFYHPKAVLIDVDTLKTLPPRELNCGMAEVIKYGLIEKSVPGVTPDLLFPMLSGELDAVISRCCQLKAAVVSADPEERLGIREILNLGHTFAHAYETLSQGDIPHGEAVAIGCVKAFETANALEQISTEDVAQLRTYFKQYHLPVSPPPGFSADDVLKCMQRDKKVQQSGTLRLVLPFDSIGQVRIQNNIDPNLIRTVLIQTQAG